MHITEISRSIATLNQRQIFFSVGRSLIMPGSIQVSFHDRWTLSAKRPVLESQTSRRKAANHKSISNVLGDAECVTPCESRAAAITANVFTILGELCEYSDIKSEHFFA